LYIESAESHLPFQVSLIRDHSDAPRHVLHQRLSTRSRYVQSSRQDSCAICLWLAVSTLTEQLQSRECLTSPGAVRDLLRLKLAGLPHEVFVCIQLDAQHRVIAIEELFRGTLTQTSVYPREVVKASLRANAAAVIFAHNHPSGVAQPSQADELLTRNLKEALSLVDVKVLDHFIVAGTQAISFAERGLL
jgi:DNA repair protein RadC